MTQVVADLVALLDVEALSPNVFRGRNTGEPRPRVFGGQVAGQALMAAGRTVAGLPAHSLHAYFLRPGNTTSPIDYEVERIRDGKSFVTRVVTATQGGEAIFHMSASFHAAEPGFSHQRSMPPTPAPEDCITWAQWLEPLVQRLPPEVATYFLRDRAIEIRPVDPMDMNARDQAGMQQRFWIRLASPIGDDPLVHQAIALYASDHTLLSVAMRPHGRTFFSRDLMAASVDHAMWLHQSFRVDQWLLFEQDSPASFGGLGLGLGHLFTQQGVLVATVAQEGLIRRVDRPGSA
ncbi:MAG TPA: acyl-CoA thioesterase II [Polyangiales bacterium]